MTPQRRDHATRAAAFDWLTEQVDRHGDVLPWTLLREGFEVQGERVALVSMQGIFKPRQMELPLSIRSSPSGPCEDQVDVAHIIPDSREQVREYRVASLPVLFLLAAR
ncbi:MAG: hypothetical protein ACOC9H_01320 [Gemmatimonadota bacterium]